MYVHLIAWEETKIWIVSITYLRTVKTKCLAEENKIIENKGYMRNVLNISTIYLYSRRCGNQVALIWDG